MDVRFRSASSKSAIAASQSNGPTTSAFSLFPMRLVAQRERLDRFFKIRNVGRIRNFLAHSVCFVETMRCRQVILLNALREKLADRYTMVIAVLW